MDVRAYVAAPSASIVRARALMDALRAAGVTVTSTWPERIAEANAKGWKHDRDVPADVLRGYLLADLEEVATSEVLVILCGKSDGSHYEAGYAERVGTYVIAVGHPHGFELLADAFVVVGLDGDQSDADVNAEIAKLVIEELERFVSPEGEVAGA